MSIRVAILIFSSLANTYALNEAHVKSLVSEKMENDYKCPSGESFWKRQVVATKLDALQKVSNTYRLRYSKFGCSLGKKGSLVISPGRSESSPEYYETALDYIASGYSPIYVVDHRGQGLSPRRLKNTFKGHVEHFQNYASDFSYFTDHVLEDLKKLGRTHTPLFFTSNSMGSAIGLTYFQNVGDKNPYKAAALLGSMIKINYLSFIDKKPTAINNRIYSEAGVIAQSSYACLIQKKCHNYSRPEVFGDYVLGKRNYVLLDDTTKMESYMTHSKERYDLRTFIWEEFNWNSIILDEYSGENWNGPLLGGATFSWTLASTKGLRKMRKKKSIKKLGSMPFLMITGEKDLRAYKPYMDGTTELSPHKNFCDRVNAKNGAKNKNLCTFIELPGSYHEIYKESDHYRDSAIHSVLEYFEKFSE